MLIRLLAVAGLVACCWALSSPARAISLGETSAFSNSIEGWFAGNGAGGTEPAVPPSVVAGGGPGGASDPYMSVTSNGFLGPGGRLVAMNDSQWSGDYTAAGVTGIEMDVRNLGATDLTLRLVFENPGVGDAAVTSTSFALPSGSDWTRVLFPIAGSDLVVLGGSASRLLADVTQLRLFHGPAASFPGARVVATLGVDNIRAVPEPAAWLLALAGAGLLVTRARSARNLRLPR